MFNIEIVSEGNRAAGIFLSMYAATLPSPKPNDVGMLVIIQKEQLLVHWHIYLSYVLPDQIYIEKPFNLYHINWLKENYGTLSKLKVVSGLWNQTETENQNRNPWISEIKNRTRTGNLITYNPIYLFFIFIYFSKTNPEPEPESIDESQLG